MSMKRSEKGLLTPDNCVVALIDHQPQMLFGVSNFDRQSIINNTVALAKAARVFALPVVLSTVESKSFSGNIWPQIKAVFPNQVPIERTSMDAWDDKNFVAAIEKSGRKKIVLAGLWTETCVALPTIQAIHDNYEVYVVEDCCGDVSQLAHDNAMKRVIQAGAKPVTALSVMLEWQRDWAETDTYDAVMDIVKTHCGAYGSRRRVCIHNDTRSSGDGVRRIRRSAGRRRSKSNNTAGVGVLIYEQGDKRSTACNPTALSIMPRSQRMASRRSSKQLLSRTERSVRSVAVTRSCGNVGRRRM